MKSLAYDTLLKVLEERMGIFIIDEGEEDFAISEYIYDSITFIEFIVALEEDLSIELSDDFLDFELLNSAKGFSEKLDDYILTR